MEKRTIIYWRGQNDARDDLISSLKGAGYQVFTVRFLADLMRRVQNTPPTAIIVDGSASEEETIHRCGELERNAVLHPVPILFLGVDAEQHADSIRRKFRRIVPLSLPFKLNVFFDKLKGLNSSVSVSSGSLTSPAAKTDTASLKAPNEGVRAPSGSLRLKREPAGYGGRILASLATADGFDDKEILPAGHPFQDRIARALTGMTKTNPWLGGHVRRVASFSNSLSRRISGKDPQETVATAGLMLNWGLLEGKSELMRADVFRDGSGGAVDKLAEAWRRSAEMARDALSDKPAAAIMEAAADLLTGKRRDDPELMRLAQVTLATELIDRACWSEGAWNSFGVLRSVRALRSRFPIPFDMNVAIGAARALAEAANTADSAATPLPAPSSPSDRAKLLESLDESYRLVGRYGEDPVGVEVRLFQLKPGMVLITPVVTRDGVFLVPGSTKLDGDLIWRIWEIAAVRPLRDPVEVLVPS